MNQPPLDNTTPNPRPTARGKFIFVGDEKYYVRGVTYGPLRAGSGGAEYHDEPTVARDFAAIVANGFNTVRTYTVPPRWLLDCAQRHGLRVLADLPWEQRLAFLHNKNLSRQIEQSVRDGVRACTGHPALLGYAIGNEIPANVVRWHGHRRIEKFIERLYRIAKTEDPGGLVAYVNYPSTEYLELPFVDLFCFNVYLETPEQFSAYLARLQNLAADKPLLLTEVGLDSHSNGEQKQAEVLDWQIRRAFAGGCAGVFAFAWTDEWNRDGKEILDWDFGLTRRDRSEKPALAAVKKALAATPLPPEKNLPRISVIVCTHNGEATLADALEGLQRIEYPDFETIVVNDGAGAGVAAVAKKFPVRLLEIPHSGLSAARNVGLHAATGSIVAYLDDDARPDAHWLRYLAQSFLTEDYAAVGGLNVPPPTNNSTAQCVAHAPGGPIHVLLTDREAEHIPGCNMAFRKSALLAIGGFDARFRTAGDDVDICWRFTDAGWKIGFNPGAMVWHQRRQTVRGYLKQQSGYGRAEALLERKWPAKYNAAGQPAWHGRIYGNGRASLSGLGRSRIYHGTWGSALFQSIYEPAPNHFWSLARMPEWHAIIFGLFVLLCLEPLWQPLVWVALLLFVAIGIPVTQAVLNAWRSPLKNFRQRALVALLNLLQPLARLRGRVSAGLTPWGRRRLRGFATPVPREFKIWSKQPRSATEWLASVEAPLAAAGTGVFRGGDYDRWDLEVRGGVLGAVRLRILVEEQNQLVRVRAWPRWPFASLAICAATTIVAGGAILDSAWIAAALFGGVALICLLATFVECAGAMGALQRTLRKLESKNR